MPIDVPYSDVQYLGGNASFNDVDINAGDTASSGTLSLNQIGTNTSSLQLRFPGGFTVASGATVMSGPTSRSCSSGQTITDNGTLSFATGDTVLQHLRRRVADRRQRDHDRRRRHLRTTSGN